MNSFIKGTLVLAVAAFIGECLEFFINLVLTKEIGEYGIGQYMSIFPVVGLVMIIASLELPISISKFVAEKDKRYHLSMLKISMKLVVIFMLIMLGVAFLIFSLFPIFSEIHPLIRWMILLLIPIISITSIARGYFMGVQNMGKIAIANLFRRVAHLALLAIIFQWFDFEVEVSILIALCAFIGGELLVFIFLMSAYIIQYRQLNHYSQKSLPKEQVVKSLVDVSLPTTGMRIFHSITHVIEPIWIKQILIISGLTLSTATEHFGVVAGVAASIGFFPAFLAHSLMTSLIPNVSQSFANRDQERLIKLLRQVIFFTLLYGVPICIGIIVFAEPLTQLFVHSTYAAVYLKMLWPYYFLHYFVIPLQAFLIGMGLVKEAFMQNIWCTFVTMTMMYILGSQESMQMIGIILAMNIGALLQFMLYYLTVCKKIGISIWFTKKEPLLT